MLVNQNQRWRDRRSSFRPAGELIQTEDYEISELAGNKDARAFVEKHHYSGSYPAARFRYGLYHRREGLVGVAVYSHPVNDRTLTSLFPGNVLEGVELGRFVLLDQVPGNAETWFLARTFELLRTSGITGVVSFSDPHPRTTVNGGRVFCGHVGTIYQAHNAVYLGRGTARPILLLPDGTVFSARCVSKIQTLDVGWKYSAELLQHFGADILDPQWEDPRVWLAYWLGKLTRKLKHTGNLKYGWGLTPQMKRWCAKNWTPQPYIKMRDLSL